MEGMCGIVTAKRKAQTGKQFGFGADLYYNKVKVFIIVDILERCLRDHDPIKATQIEEKRIRVKENIKLPALLQP